MVEIYPRFGLFGPTITDFRRPLEDISASVGSMKAKLKMAAKMGEVRASGNPFTESGGSFSESRSNWCEK